MKPGNPANGKRKKNPGAVQRGDGKLQQGPTKHPHISSVTGAWADEREEEEI